MNNKISAPSLETIQETLTSRDLDSLEILEWESILTGKKNINIKMGQLDYQHLAPYLAIPDIKDILSQFLKICYENQWRILPLGNGSKLHWGKLTSAHFLVSTQKLNQVIEYSKDDLTITVQSGMKLADLQRFLQPYHQFLPIDAFYPEWATVGGIVATANTGSWRQGYGGVRDLILGISFLRGDGEEAKAGGKVVKNVAGYDLMKLFTGSYGNLGIITEITFRLFPLPSHSRTLVLTGEKNGIQTLQKTITNSGLTPTMGDVISHNLLSSLGLSGDLGLVVRFQGIEESVKQQSARVEMWGKGVNLSVSIYEYQEEENFWQTFPKNIYLGEKNSFVAKLGILSSKAVDFLSTLEGNGLINISTGLGHLLLKGDVSKDKVMNLRDFCEVNGGFLTILQGDESLKKIIEPWGYVGNNGLTMMKKIKTNFDPKGILANRL